MFQRVGPVGASVALLLFATPLAGAAAVDETIRCSRSEAFAGGGGRTVEASLSYRNGRLARVDLSTSVSNGEEGGAYACSFAATTTDKGVDWSREGGVDVLDSSRDAGAPSFVAVATRPRLAVVASRHLARYYCGFGAEWPEYVIVPRQGGKCIVGPAE